MYLLQIIISQKTKKPILFENRLYFDPPSFPIAPSPLPSPQQKGRGEEEVKVGLILSKIPRYDNGNVHSFDNPKKTR
jgi:hypothetical protein